MANNKNLKPVRSKREARERGRKGGIKSAEKRREKKSFQERAKWLLELPVSKDKIKDDTKIKSISEMINSNSDVATEILIAIYKKAKFGDVKAAEFLRDTAGFQPVQKQEVKQEINPLSDISTEDLKKIIDKL